MKTLLLFLFTFLVVEGLNTGDHKDQAKKLTELLESQGYTVQYGTYEYMTPDRCQEMDTCYANNPSSPYGIIFLPKGPQEDVSTYSNWGKILMTQVDGVNMSSNYRLDTNETIVMLGQTPPRSLYFSYATYVFDRWYPYNWTSNSSSQVSKCPHVENPDGSRSEIFASLGDPINMISINTSTEDGDAFSSGFSLFMSGDANQMSLIQEMGSEAGIQPNIQNTFGLSTSRINLGLNRTSDGLSHLLRTAFTENIDDHEKYIQNASEYVTILRITPPLGTPGPSFPPYQFKSRVSEQEKVEGGLTHEELQAVLEDEINDAVIRMYAETYPFFQKQALTEPNFENGYECMDLGMKCNGDNQDALYPNSANFLVRSKLCTATLGRFCPVSLRSTLEEDGSDFFIVTGVNHNTTGSLYSSISMYNTARLESLGSFTSVAPDLDENSYVGSAVPFVSDPELAKHFFVVKVSRECMEDDQFCLEVPLSRTESGPNPLPSNDDLLVIERIYLEKMLAGPTKDATVKPIIYHFSKTRFGRDNALLDIDASKLEVWFEVAQTIAIAIRSSQDRCEEVLVQKFQQFDVGELIETALATHETSSKAYQVALVISNAYQVALADSLKKIKESVRYQNIKDESDLLAKIVCHLENLQYFQFE